MSTCIAIEFKCGVCGNTSVHRVLTSTIEFGSCDLDFRPAEMRRSTMDTWVQECPHCGYVSSELSEKTDIPEEWFKSNEYLSCDNLAFKSDLAKVFYKQYLIFVKTNDSKEAHFAALHAAWACDDAGDTENARICRMKSLEELNKTVAAHGESDYELSVKADLLRRTEQFDLLIKEYSPKIAKKLNEMWIKKRELDNGTIDNESYDQIKSLVSLLIFQDKKAREKDSACYSMREVFGVPF